MVMRLCVAAALAAGVPGAPNVAAQQAAAQTQPGDLTTPWPVIQGYVRLSNGDPAPSVIVRLQPQAGGPPQSATTGPDGHYSFRNNSTGPALLVVEVPGFQPVRTAVAIPSDVAGAPALVDFVLVPVARSMRSDGESTVSVKSLEVPSKARGQYERGIQNMLQGNYAAAEKSFLNATKTYPDYAACFQLLAAAYAAQGRFPQAHQSIQRAFEIEPRNSENYIYLGYVNVKEGKLDEAEGAFSKGVATSQNDWFAQYALGMLGYQQRNYQSSYTYATVAHNLRPQFLKVHLLLYNDLVQLGKTKEALAELDDILARFPKCPQVPQLRQFQANLRAQLSQAAR